MALTVSVSDLPNGTENRLDMRIGCYICFAFATIAIFARIYVRMFMARKIGLDDILIFAAWICEVVVIVAVKKQFDAGIGWHASDLAALPIGTALLTRAVLWPWVSQFLYFFGLGCIKASIVALYLRLAVTSIQRKILWTALVIVFAQGVSSTVVVAGFLCTPLDVIWTGTHGGFGGPACVDILGFNYWNAAFFIFTDVCLALAPIPVLKNLHMDRKKKASLIIMFSLGLLAIGGTISRQVTNAIAITSTADFTWYWAPAELCSVLESSLGIIFVCVPSLAPLFTPWFSAFGTSNKHTDTAGFRSDRPSTFGKLGGRVKLRPDDESILCQTQVTAIDAKDRDGALDSYEMDHEARYYSGDSGSERRIVTPPKIYDGKTRDTRVMVNVEYRVNRTTR